MSDQINSQAGLASHRPDMTTQAVWSQLTGGAILPPKPTEDVSIPELMDRMQAAVDDLDDAVSALRDRVDVDVYLDRGEDE